MGIDPEREPVPVAPAAHYTMGGVATDLDGRSTLPGLYAVGESACTRPPRGQPAGVELARRVLRLRPPRRARRAARARAAGRARRRRRSRRRPALPPDATRAALWRHAGLQRDAEGLRELAGDPFPLARLIAAACLAREESRGAHQRIDHPATDPALDRMHNLVGGSARPAFETWT